MTVRYDECTNTLRLPIGQGPQAFSSISLYGDVLLRITLDRSGAIVRLRLEGRLTGPWVRELERCWADLHSEQRRGAVADLAGVTFIGEDGRQLLVKLWEEGAVLHATDCLTRSIVETITGPDPSTGCTS